MSRSGQVRLYPNEYWTAHLESTWKMFLFVDVDDFWVMCICALWWQIFCRHILYTDTIFITKIDLMNAIFLCISPASLFVCCLVLSSLCLHPLLFHLPHPLPSLRPSLEGEESRRFIKAPVRGGSQEKTSLTSLFPAHPRPLISRPRRWGHRPCPPSPPPSPLRFLSDGITGASRLLSNRERYGRGHRTGASAQEVRLPGHQFSQVAPSNAHWQCSDGSPAWTQTPVQREVGTCTDPHRKKLHPEKHIY